MMPARVSVIVLNYNGAAWLRDCLGAIAAQRGAPSFEVVVVDNASSDDSASIVRGEMPAARFIASAKNLGFAGGNNLGARQADGEWLVFLNNDTKPAADWLARLCAPLDRDPGVAAATSRIVFMRNPGTIDSAGDGYLRAGGAFKHGHRQPVAIRATSGEVFGVCGAAFVVRRRVFEEIGGFDERFFMVYEDVDLSYRMRLAGYRCWYAADAVVEHAGSGTLGQMSDRAVFFGQRNMEWTWIKNTPWPLLLRTALAHALYSTAGLIHYARVGRLGPALRGKASALAGLPKVLRDRQRQTYRRAGAGELEPWMERRWLGIKHQEKRRESRR